MGSCFNSSGMPRPYETNSVDFGRRRTDLRRFGPSGHAGFRQDRQQFLAADYLGRRRLWHRLASRPLRRLSPEPRALLARTFLARPRMALLRRLLARALWPRALRVKQTKRPPHRRPLCCSTRCSGAPRLCREIFARSVRLGTYCSRNGMIGGLTAAIATAFPFAAEIPILEAAEAPGRPWSSVPPW
jgi:hypothetical protein